MDMKWRRFPEKNRRFYFANGVNELLLLTIFLI